MLKALLMIAGFLVGIVFAAAYERKWIGGDIIFLFIVLVLAGMLFGGAVYYAIGREGSPWASW